MIVKLWYGTFVVINRSSVASWNQRFKMHESIWSRNISSSTDPGWLDDRPQKLRRTGSELECERGASRFEEEQEIGWAYEGGDRGR